jgi:hypothetical protein
MAAIKTKYSQMYHDCVQRAGAIDVAAESQKEGYNVAVAYLQK